MISSPGQRLTRTLTTAVRCWQSRALRPIRHGVLLGAAHAPSALAQVAPSPQAQEVALGPLAEVVIVASTPLRGAELTQDQVAGAVQRVDGEQIHATRGATLADVLQQNLAGVTLNESQGSPFLPDLNYRGFTSSPLLGLPQGLAIYQNGTRLNEPFGDTVAWDLIPEFAIEEATLLSSSNPAYGLNALGGALSLRMKDGFSFEGARLGLLGGSFGRVRGTLEAGLQRDGWAAYAAGDVLREAGYRDHSPARAGRFYADVRRRSEHHELALNATLANSSLTGNGPAPLELLAERRQAVFTYPDETKTSLALVTAEAGWSPSPALELTATAFLRGSLRQTFNGDAFDLQPCDDVPTVLCAEGEEDDVEAAQDVGEPVIGASGGPIPSSAGGDAATNTTRTRSRSTGATVQLVSRHRLGERDNQLTIGVSAARAVNEFLQRSEVGTFLPDRGVQGSGYFMTEGAVDLEASSVQLGVYASDTLALLPALFLTASGRFNWVALSLREDQIEALNADHRFSRLNPAVGLAYTPRAGATLFANYAEANRAPTPAELSCADPEEPCRLPNAFLSDPPLAQVVTRSVELGGRLTHELDADTALSASLALFVARSRDDISFVAGSRVGTGYFRNAGTTQRAGLEATFSARLGRLDAYLGYQFLRATFESSLLLPGANHPDATTTPEGDVIAVEPGDRIPGLPQHALRVGADLEPLDGLAIGAWVNASSSQHYRGDEANLLQPLPGYATLNARGSVELARWALLFVRLDNVLNAKLETFGLLGEPDEVIPDAEDPRYASPGPPRSVWVGLDLRLSP
jgi:outer membrane receptor protein involved in Fe transport